MADNLPVLSRVCVSSCSQSAKEAKMRDRFLVDNFLAPALQGRNDAIVLTLSELEERKVLDTIRCVCHAFDVPFYEVRDHNIFRADVAEFRRKLLGLLTSPGGSLF
jgi:hypothetical protein